jgi:flagella basal body P-ring formation protein FlgA
MMMKTFALAIALATIGLACAAQESGVEIAVPSRDISRGETISQADLVLQAVPPDRMRAGLATHFADLSGHEARRLLRAGEPVRIEDLRMPVLVAKGATVVMSYSEPGITLTATGRAMAEGGLGETVMVQNPSSFRQVACIVTGPGEVRAGGTSATERVASNP